MGPRRSTALLLAGIVLVACVMRAPITGVGSLLPTISADVHLGSTAAGLLTALPLLAFAAASGVVPRLAGRLGLRRTLFAALLLLVAGCALRSAPGVVPLFAGTAVLGVAIAVVNVLLPALLRREFPSRVAVMTSGYVVVMGLVGSVAAGAVVPLADTLPGGWRTALAVWGAPALLAAAVWTAQLRRAEPVTAPGAHVRAPWRSPLAWAVTAFMGCQSVTFYVLVAWLPTVLRDRAGLGAAAAGWHLSLMQGAGVLASLAIPFVASSVTRSRRASVATSLVTALGFLLLLVAPHQTGLASVVVGLGGGATVVLALSAISARAADAAGAAALSGMAQSVGYLLAAAGPVTIGALHAATGSWTVPLAVLTLLAAVQAAVAWAAGRDAVVA
ncbi:MFS transporter [Kineococcus rubinsiae]|uniref:MFS transporter n=1 Tax=Kineococcus rubinsiae TaxID=2609562 RepID=UPI001431D905|nr:MFS transporter [Kineococcus rubinsiae]NIZ91895.1 MFS transporter [Kineococcus rubinsiae]